MAAWIKRLGMVAAATGLAACDGVVPSGVVDNSADSATGTDASACDASVYPCGPYNKNIGDVMEELSFVGRVESNNDGNLTVDDAAGVISLSKYYQNKNVRALIVSASAEWCQPCQHEQPALKAAFEANEGRLAILETLVQNKVGNPAVIETTDVWRNQFSIPFDLVVDPAYALAPYYEITAFPMNMLIDPRTMQIVWQGNGVPKPTQDGASNELFDAAATLLATPRE